MEGAGGRVKTGLMLGPDFFFFKKKQAAERIASGCAFL